jgi:hypothetical protein
MRMSVAPWAEVLKWLDPPLDFDAHLTVHRSRYFPRFFTGVNHSGRFSLGCRAPTPVTQGDTINMRAQFDRETAKKLESEL